MIYEGKLGEGRKFAMNILTNIGELYDASRLINVQAVQLSCPHSQLGAEGWLALVKKFASHRIKVTVPTYTEAQAQTSPDQFSKITNLFQDQYERQLKGKKALQDKLGGLYKKLGFHQQSIFHQARNFTNKSGKTYMAISDAGTAVFLNSYYGIRTNNESSSVALAAAVTGKTTLSGLHLIENRIPDIQIRLHAELNQGDWPLIGLHIGKKYKKAIPFIKLINNKANIDEKEFFEISSALAEFGRIPMFHIEDFTPEHKLYQPTAIKNKIRFTEKDQKKLYDQWKPLRTPDIVIVGAPFAGLDELKNASVLLKKRKSKGVPDLWIFTQKETQIVAKKSGFLKNIEESNAKLFYDCWFEDAPVELLDDYRIVTDSIRTLSAVSKRKGKTAHVKYLPTADCLKLASTGEVPQ